MYYFLGRVLGWIFMLTIIKPMRIIYGLKDCEYIYNEEVMRSMQGKSILVVSNHIKPRNKFLRLISIPYDAFIIRHFFLKYDIYTTALTSYDSGKVKRGQRAQNSKKNKEILTKGIVKSMDLIPLNRNEKDKETDLELKERISKGNLGIGIFPEGTWFRGFRKKRKIFPGAAVLSKRLNLPILPVYLQAYNLNGKLVLKIGEPISSELPSEIISQKIREELNRLYDIKSKDGATLARI